MRMSDRQIIRAGVAGLMRRRRYGLAVATVACGGGDGDEQATTSTVSPRTSVAAASSPPPGIAVTVPAAPPTVPPVCTVTIVAGDSLTAIANGSGLALEALLQENAIDATATIHPGEQLDICVGNDVDDVSGASRLAPPADAVLTQQAELNQLLADTSMLPLALDGDSGDYTRQAACLARMGLGLPVHNGHITAGSEEEAAIFAATELAIPEGAPVAAQKWILVDKTCQVIFIGEGDERIVDVFPTSTGEPGFETYNVQVRAFRFDPATDNGGWHDSSTFPTEVDNPANGNMYKPLYFNNGQAIHGAGYIPPTPQSKGCARTFPLHQDMIVEWLGLDDLTEATWNPDQIDVTVVVQGRYRDRSPD
jgi:LysM repeat protein